MPKKGEKMSKEAREKLSASCMGRTAWNKGIPHTDAAKEKMSAKKVGIPLSEEHKKIYQLLTKGRFRI